MEKIKRATLFFLVSLLFPALAFAQDTEEYTYAPEECAFTATFPFEPGFVKRCPSDTSLPCFDIAQFTERYEGGHAMNVEMSCIPLTKEIYDTYNQENMTQLVINLSRDANLPEVPRVSYEETESGIKIAGAGGLKKSGFVEKIFMTQLWVHPDSIMTVEGELSLETEQSADEQFANILNSIQPKDNPVSQDNAE